jgi:hypothetical protein
VKRFFRVVAVLVIMMIVLLSWGRGPEGWQRILSLMVFAAVVLAPQLLMLLSRKRRTAPAGDPLPESDVATPSVVMEDARRDDAGSQEAAPALPAQFVPAPAPRVRRRPPVAPAATVSVTRRHSRRALLGSKRSVQDAMVVATILGRCRAMDPHHPD